MHPTDIFEDCLGPGALLYPGDVQSVVFLESDLPTLYALTANRHDVIDQVNVSI